MYKKTRIVALVMAAGTGSRFKSSGTNTPKQLAHIEDKPMVAYAVEAFLNCSFVDEVAVVVSEDIYQAVDSLFSAKIPLVLGGETRQASVLRGLVGARVLFDLKETDIVLIHDAARPNVPADLICQVVKSTYELGAAVPGLALVDTIKTVEDGFIESTLDRDRLRAVQTPQGFLFGKIYQLHRRAAMEGIFATDDASIFEHYGERVGLVEGSQANKKITFGEDIKTATLMKNCIDRQESFGIGATRVGIGVDVHRLVEGRDLILGGVKIPHTKGLLGHSDADVLTHAIMDAILGAMALGDIGQHFSDTDERYKDISSLRLLGEVMTKMKALGYKVFNCSAVIICQQPKLADYLLRIAENLAVELEIDISQIGLTATTTEGLGLIGREEGIGVKAVVLCQATHIDR